MTDRQALTPTRPPATNGGLTGIVFALGVEAGSLLDRMKQARTTQGNGWKYHAGLLGGRNYVLVESGIGCEKARQATDRLLSIFRPNRILSAGFAGALDPTLARNVICRPTRILHGKEVLTLSADIPPCTLLTADRIVDTIADKRRLWKATGANLVDMESFAVAKYCLENRVEFRPLRIVFDPTDEELPKEIRSITSPKHGTVHKLGAIAGALFRRPSSLLDLYQLKERALIAADRLAVELEREASE